MKQIKWHEAKKELPQEGQDILCMYQRLRTITELNATLATFANGQFWQKYESTSRYKDDSIASYVLCKVVLENVCLWADANEIFRTADKLLTKISTPKQKQS